MSAALTIKPARDAADIAAASTMVWEFFDYVKARYPDRKPMIDAYIADQDVTLQLSDFARHFNPPAGECLLAWLGDAPVGMVMLKPQKGEICELNRMYVRSAARGKGAGRALCLALMDTARTLGYRTIRLDAVDETVEAVPLYRSLGFTPDPDPPAFVKTDPRIISLRRAL